MTQMKSGLRTGFNSKDGAGLPARRIRILMCAILIGAWICLPFFVINGSWSGSGGCLEFIDSNDRWLLVTNFYAVSKAVDDSGEPLFWQFDLAVVDIDTGQRRSVEAFDPPFHFRLEPLNGVRDDPIPVQFVQPALESPVRRGLSVIALPQSTWAADGMGLNVRGRGSKYLTPGRHWNIAGFIWRYARYLGVGFPVLAVLLLLTVIVTRRGFWFGVPLGECARCGYDLRATAHTCPECGEVRRSTQTHRPDES